MRAKNSAARFPPGFLQKHPPKSSLLDSCLFCVLVHVFHLVSISTLTSCVACPGLHSERTARRSPTRAMDPGSQQRSKGQSPARRLGCRRPFFVHCWAYNKLTMTKVHWIFSSFESLELADSFMGFPLRMSRYWLRIRIDRPSCTAQAIPGPR